jgi:hypothetical protein
MIDPISASYAHVASTASTATTWLIAGLSSRGPNSRLKEMQRSLHSGIKIVHDVKPLLTQDELYRITMRFQRWVCNDALRYSANRPLPSLKDLHDHYAAMPYSTRVMLSKRIHYAANAAADFEVKSKVSNILPHRPRSYATNSL